MSDFSLNFQDTETAFADLSDKELKEKHRLFKLFNSPLLSSVGTRATTLAIKLGLPVSGMIKRTIFDQFCGGESIEECGPRIERLGRSGIGTILDFSIEGITSEEAFDATKEEILRTVRRAKDDGNIPFAVFKVSGIAPLGTLERMSARKKLDAKSQSKCEHLTKRISDICAYAYSIGQPILIDAEETWIQSAIDRVAEEMMERYNRERPIVFNTGQLYRTDRLENIQDSRRRAQQNGYMYAIKLVRGAYMEKERERAEEQGYPSPIYDDKAGTDDAFNAAAEYCLDHIDTTAFMVGTHNEASTSLIARRMHERGIPNEHPHVWFSQLFGMGDNISYVLAKHGYNVAKYLPYGPVKETVPYLIRRAEENTSAAGQVSRELELIGREVKRRGL